ncbi:MULTISPECIES: glycosyltransferase [unclassified Dietzia]|uniref:glycosyltransferase n=1 Tax=unclassified Dietzia TaxID=2617939 RepID=UPI0015F970DD|nr:MULTISPECIES: glycosyltransferase [unclassified Dietzia]MBB1023683.1 glycosyltransferase family 4 protein [Dietzia sp. DQ12-76]MBB1027243.1 glycosyltransferase family 4 protein [Dietzia sp. DQ11-38-2]
MRIGIVANIGAHFDAFWVDIVASLREQGNQVFLAASDPAQRISSVALDGITRRPSLTNFKARRSIREWSKLHDLDVIVTNTATPSALVRMVNPGIPVVYFAHGLHWSNQRTITGLGWKGIERLLVGRTSGFIAINDEDEEWLRKYGGNVPMLRLKYGVGLDLNDFPSLPFPSDHNLVWIGEFTERKRPLEAVKVMKDLVRSNPQAHLFMLGRGPLRSEVLALISKYRLQTFITLPGRVPPIDYFARSRALLHTATWEGLPRVALEALAVGRPVIGYSIKGLNGLPGTALAGDGEIAELTGIASSVLDAPELFQTQMVREELSWQDVADRLPVFLSGIVRTS